MDKKKKKKQRRRNKESHAADVFGDFSRLTTITTNEYFRYKTSTIFGTIFGLLKKKKKNADIWTIGKKIHVNN